MLWGQLHHKKEKSQSQIRHNPSGQAYNFEKRERKWPMCEKINVHRTKRLKTNIDSRELLLWICESYWKFQQLYMFRCPVSCSNINYHRKYKLYPFWKLQIDAIANHEFYLRLYIYIHGEKIFHYLCWKLKGLASELSVDHI